MGSIKIIVEKHEDGYVSYAVGMRGIVVGEGDTYDEALADVRSAIRLHIETFGARTRSPNLTIVSSRARSACVSHAGSRASRPGARYRG